MDHSFLFPAPLHPLLHPPCLGICPGWSEEFVFSSQFTYSPPLMSAFSRFTANTEPFVSSGLGFVVCSASCGGGSQRTGHRQSQLLFALPCGLSRLTLHAVLVIDAVFWCETQPEPGLIPNSSHSASFWRRLALGREASQKQRTERHCGFQCSPSLPGSPAPAGRSLCVLWPEFVIVFGWRVRSV